MKTGDKGINLIKSFEGCQLKAYKCPAGVWTIGYGHTAGVKEGQTITKAQALQYLKEDLSKHEKYVEQYVTIDITQEQFDALVSFSFNCGAGNLKKSKMVSYTNSYDFKKASDSFSGYSYAKVNGEYKQLAGLVRRREAESKLYLEGSYNPYTKPLEPITNKSSYESVKWLQWALNVFITDGKLKDIPTKLVVDGLYGKKTAKAVVAYLKYKGWYTGEQTGYYVGNGTIKSLS